MTASVCVKRTYYSNISNFYSISVFSYFLKTDASDRLYWTYWKLTYWKFFRCPCLTIRFPTFFINNLLSEKSFWFPFIFCSFSKLLLWLSSFVLSFRAYLTFFFLASFHSLRLLFLSTADPLPACLFYSVKRIVSHRIQIFQCVKANKIQNSTFDPL